MLNINKIKSLERYIPYILLLVIVIDISLKIDQVLFMNNNGIIASLFQPLFIFLSFIILPIKSLTWFLIYNLIVLFFTYYSFRYGDKHNKIFIILAWSSLLLTYFINIIVRYPEISLFRDYYNIFYFLSFLISLNGFETYFRINKPDTDKLIKIINIVLLYIGIVFIISYLTGTAVESYPKSDKIGFSGWYVSSNSIGHLLTITFPLILYYLLKHKNKLGITAIILSILSQLMIGTKAPYLGIILTTLIFIFVSIFDAFIKRKINKYKIIFLIISLFVIVSIYPVIPLSHNINVLGVSENRDILSGRRKFLSEKATNTKEQYGKVLLITFGKNSDSKLVEIDYFDIFFNNGIYGSLVFIIILGYYLLISILKIVSNFKENISKNTPYIIPICLMLGIAAMAGHIFVGSYISIYSAFLIILLLYKVGGIKHEKK